MYTPSGTELVAVDKVVNIALAMVVGLCVVLLVVICVVVGQCVVLVVALCVVLVEDIVADVGCFVVSVVTLNKNLIICWRTKMVYNIKRDGISDKFIS